MVSYSELCIILLSLFTFLYLALQIPLLLFTFHIQCLIQRILFHVIKFYSGNSCVYHSLFLNVLHNNILVHYAFKNCGTGSDEIFYSNSGSTRQVLSFEFVLSKNFYLHLLAFWKKNKKLATACFKYYVTIFMLYRYLFKIWV